MNFSDEHSLRLDSKNRLELPPDFLTALRGGAVATRGFEHCIAVFATEAWQRFAEGLSDAPVTDPEARSRARFVFSGARQLELDHQGRLELPGALLEYAGVGKSVAVVGAGGHFEVWDAARWRDELSRVIGSYGRPDAAEAKESVSAASANGQGEDAGASARSPRSASAPMVNEAGE